MKYNRKLTANHYRGCNDRLAKAIDIMAGLEPDTLQEIPSYSWRGDSREINSSNNSHYDRLAKNINKEKVDE